jgi:signal transduction histidine kinase
MAAAGVKPSGSRRTRRRERLVVQATLLGGLAAVIAAVQLLVLLALGRFPTGEERAVLALSMIAAAIAALVYQPMRARLERFATRLTRPQQEAPGDGLHAIGTRLSRALPLDDVLLELAESLRRELQLDGAEVWTGSDGLLERAASDPDRGSARLQLTSAEEAVVARAGVSGPPWLAVWLPALLERRGGGPLSVAPIANAGELLGLIVVERTPGRESFSDRDTGVLAELARQVGFALRNVRLDSQLQASLDELRRQTEQLRVSRARVVSAADAERRRIERDLHDGAQQRLVALAANLSLARELARSDPTQTTVLLEQLGEDVQSALEDLREIAHGIYPPLLADRGLADALSAVAGRAPIQTRIEVQPRSRYSPQIEATVYFCCLEALQNAGKHAGRKAIATLAVRETEGALVFEVRDDGSGFSPAHARDGAGLANMTDRLGAIGGSLRVESSPGRGTRVVGTIPLHARRW